MPRRVFQIGVTKQRELSLVVRIEAPTEEMALAGALQRARHTDEAAWDWTDESQPAAVVLDTWEEKEDGN